MYKHYDESFKANAVRVFQQSDSLQAAARSLGLRPRLLYRWVNKEVPPAELEPARPRPTGRTMLVVAPARLAYRARFLDFLHQQHALFTPNWPEWAKRTGVSTSALRHYITGLG